MNLEELRTKYKADILKIAEKYGVTDIRVFGSVARGDARPDSDVDLLVKYPQKFSLIDLISMQNELKQKLNRNVDVASLKNIHWSIKQDVINEISYL